MTPDEYTEMIRHSRPEVRSKTRITLDGTSVTTHYAIGPQRATVEEAIDDARAFRDIYETTLCENCQLRHGHLIDLRPGRLIDLFCETGFTAVYCDECERAYREYIAAEAKSDSENQR